MRVVDGAAANGKGNAHSYSPTALLRPKESLAKEQHDGFLGIAREAYSKVRSRLAHFARSRSALSGRRLRHSAACTDPYRIQFHDGSTCSTQRRLTDLNSVSTRVSSFELRCVAESDQLGSPCRLEHLLQRLRGVQDVLQRSHAESVSIRATGPLAPLTVAQVPRGHNARVRRW